MCPEELGVSLQERHKQPKSEHFDIIADEKTERKTRCESIFQQPAKKSGHVTTHPFAFSGEFERYRDFFHQPSVPVPYDPVRWVTVHSGYLAIWELLSRYFHIPWGRRRRGSKSTERPTTRFAVRFKFRIGSGLRLHPQSCAGRWKISLRVPSKYTFSRFCTCRPKHRVQNGISIGLRLICFGTALFS